MALNSIIVDSIDNSESQKMVTPQDKVNSLPQLEFSSFRTCETRSALINALVISYPKRSFYSFLAARPIGGEIAVDSYGG
jgi:hypothetical protein